MPNSHRALPKIASIRLLKLLPLTAVGASLMAPFRVQAADLAASGEAVVADDGGRLSETTGISRLAFVADKLAEWQVILGGGAKIAPRFEGSDEFEVSPVPFVSASFGDMVEVDPGGVSVDLLHARGFSVSGRLGYDFGRQEDDADHLRGLGDVDAGAVVGGRVAYAFGAFEPYVAVNRIIGGSDGLEAKLGADVSFRYERFLFSVGVSGTWSDDNYMEAYFGVTPQQSANSGLAAYDVGAGIKRFDVEASVTYMATEHWLIRGQAGLGTLVGDAADSPVVQREVQPYGMIALGYKF